MTTRPTYTENLTSSTGSAFHASLTFTAQVAPKFLLVTVAGLLVDRVDKKRILVGSILLRTGTMTALFTILAGGNLAAVYVVLAIDAAITAFAQPAASSLVPALARPERLQSANALLSTAYSIAQLVSPALGSLLLLWLPVSYTVASTVVLYLTSALVLFWLPGNKIQNTAAPAGFTESLKGFALIVRTRVLASLHLTLVVAWFSQGILLTVAIPWLDGIMGLTSDLFGLVVAAMGLGMVAGGLVTSVWATWAPGKGYVFGAAGSATMLMVTAFLVTMPAILAVFVASGIFFAVFNAARSTLVQTASAPDSLGRVFAVQGAVIEGARLMGILVGPVLLNVLTPGGALFAAGMLALLGGLAYTPLAVGMGQRRASGN